MSMRLGSSRRSSRVMVALIAILFLFFLLARGLFEQTLHIFQRPAVRAGTWVLNALPFLEPNNYDSKRIGELENRVIELALDQTKLKQFTEENAALKATLGFIERQNVRSVMASVVSRSRDIQSSLFSIDRGREDGIRIGDPVIVKDGILVGKIANVTPKSATVLSLTDPTVATAVSILNQTQTIGVAQGLAGNLLRLRFIPQGTDLSVNDLVVSSGLESSIPSGLLIGLITDVQPEENAPFLEAVIEPLIDMRRYTTVHVLIQEAL